MKRLLLAGLIAGSFVLPSSLRAQQDSAATAPVAPVATQATVSETTVAGPRIDPVGVTSRLQVAPIDLGRTYLSDGEHVGRDKAYMGVGLAAIIVGIIVGGDVGTIFIVGGGVMGLVGLFRYMR